jgi:translation initiation factor IF-3
VFDNQASEGVHRPPPFGPRCGTAGSLEIETHVALWRPWLDPSFGTRYRRVPISFPGGCAISTDKRVRVNRQIRISPVRVIASDGEQLGIMPIEEALATAENEGLDLVEVAPTARPPVVRIMDYGKFKYEEARKTRQARKKQHQILIKEVKFRPGIEPHDFDFKIRHARRFLEEGNKVKVTMMFRGRQIANPEAGREVMVRVADVLDDLGKVEQMPSMEGRTMTMVVAPKKVAS